jgi:gluconolactonase
MNLRKWPILVLLSAGAAAAIAVACSETGPDAGPRTNGCISEGCFDGGYLVNDGGTTTLPDGAVVGPDGEAVITDPLAGITPLTATLIKGGLNFTEGPVWIGGRLIFSDVNANPSILYELLGDGGLGIFRSMAGKPNGNAVDPQGRLVTCESAQSQRRLTRTDAQLAGRNPIATTFNGNGFNEPNDVIVRGDGNVYFTDPRYSNDPDGGQDKLAVYRLPPGAAVDGAQRLAFDFNKPNGIALSPDGNTLYVVDNGDGRLLGAQLNADGTVNGPFQKLADTDGGDGRAVDDRGNLYVAATAGILVFDKNGAALGTITIPQGAPSNCTFGGSDRKTLFITSNLGAGNAATGLYSIKLNVPGLP